MKSKATLRISWRWFEIGLVILSLALYAAVAFGPFNRLLNWFNNDDAFYYFKVAQNITAGQGVSFDGVNITNGFHPLWMLICIPLFALARFDLVLPLRLVVVVSALLNAATGVLLFRLLRRFVLAQAAALAAVLWLFLPGIQSAIIENGLESSLSAFCLLALLYLVVCFRGSPRSTGRLILTGLVAALTLLARLDNVFFVMLIGVWFVLDFTTVYLRAVVVGDLTMIFIVGLLGYYARLSPGVEYLANVGSLPFLLVLGFTLKPLFLFLFGLYDPHPEKFSWKLAARTLAAILLSSAILGAALLLFQRLGLYKALPRSVILFDFAGTLVFVPGLRLLAGAFFKGEGDANPLPVRSRAFWKAAFLPLLGYFVPVAILEGLYMGWSYSYAGTPLPVSGQIKQWWGGQITAYGSPNHTFLELLGMSGSRSAWNLMDYTLPAVLKNLVSGLLQPETAAVVGYIGMGLILAAGIFFLVRSGRWTVSTFEQLGLFVLFGSIYAHIFSYTATSYVHMRLWYWSSEALFTVILVALAFERVLLALQKQRRAGSAAGAVLLVVCCLLALTPGLTAYGARYWVDRGQNGELLANDFIEANTEPGALIGMTGGGTVGYFLQDRVIVNLDGLINSPEYFQAMKDGTAADYLDRIGLGYVYGNVPMLTQSEPYEQIFKNRLQQVGESSDYTLFKYTPAP